MKVITLAVIATGIVSQYAPGVMPRVISYRQAHQQIPEDLADFDGAIAVLNCNHIGQVFYLRPSGCHTCKWERFIAADCAGKADGGYNWMLYHNVIAEVDYQTAVRWNTVGRGIKAELAIRQLYYLPRYIPQ